MQHLEVLAALESYVKEQLSLLLPPARCWQPSDFLPDSSRDDWPDAVRALRERARAIPDTVLVGLVGNMLTEEALPTYHAWLANLEHGFDKTGAGENAMALWMRGWVAEEQRHGDLLTKYLYLSGRVDGRAVDRTLQHLISRGFASGTKNSVYHGFIYTSFQERATQISHIGLARLARQAGADDLAEICDAVAGDEARHERAYSRFVGKLFAMDPDGALVAFAEMLRKGIVMPAENMTDGADDALYELFTTLSQRTGMYTGRHYADIADRLVRKWDCATAQPLSAEGRAAQDFVCRYPEKLKRLAERAERKLPQYPDRPISWIFGRSLAAAEHQSVAQAMLDADDSASPLSAVTLKHASPPT